MHFKPMVNLHDEVLQLLHKSCTSGAHASLVKLDIVQIFQYIGLFKVCGLLFNEVDQFVE